MIYSITLYLIQDKLIYHPHKSYIAPSGQLSVFEEKIVNASDETPILIWRAKAKNDKPAILFFHGNAGQIATFAPHLLIFIKHGYPVIMMEYRGFGAMKAKGGQDKFFSDSLAVFDWLKQQGYKKIIVYGYSLGTAMAVNVARYRKVDGLILTAPFSSMRNLVGEKPIPLARFLLKDHYDSLKKIKDIQTPTLIIHGKKDKLIPYHHSKILYDAAASSKKSLIFLENENHNSVFFTEANVPVILDWLKENKQ